MNYSRSRSNTNYMRQNTLRRTREMQRQNMQESNVQAQKVVAESEEDNSQQETAKEKKDCPRAVSSNKKQNSNSNNILSGLFSNGKLDNDKILIIALIIILAKEGADLKLLLALGYILM